MSPVVIGGQRPLGGFGRGQLCQMHAPMATRRSALAGPTVVPGPYPERSYLQGATTLDGETLFRQPDRRMHRTGLGCTSLHRFRATAIFYPNFYLKVQQSGAGMLYVLVIAANRSGRPGCVTSLPSWSCGFDSRRPLRGNFTFMKNFRFTVRSIVNYRLVWQHYSVLFGLSRIFEPSNACTEDRLEPPLLNAYVA